MTLEGASVAGRVVGGQSVFFPEIGRDMDASVAPTVGGAELFAVLRSRLSPEQVRYRVALPAGASLQMTPDGGAAVVRGGVVLADIKPPSARDAQGSVVPVTMSVAGDELLLGVSHRHMDVAYPVLVDPTVTTKGATGNGWYFGASAEAYIAWSHGSLSVSAGVTFPLKVGGGFNYSAEGQWTLIVPEHLVLNKVEWLGVSGSTSATGKGATYWRLFACDGGTGYNSGTPPTSFSTEYSTNPCLVTPWFTINLALYGNQEEEVNDSGSISVESILMTYTPTLVEEEEIGSGSWGEGSRGAPGSKGCFLGKPVNCATGNQVETQPDLSVGGRGPGLAVTRTYNSQRAALQGRMATPGPFGYGWTGTGSAHLTFPTPCWRQGQPGFEGAFCEQRGVDVYEDNGSSVYFEGKPGGPYTASTPLLQATLVKEGTSYIYTLPNQTKLEFNSEGKLVKETDRNGNAVTLAYNAETKRLETVTDAAGRKLTYAYNGEGQVETVKDPMGHTAKYAYESKNLASVTLPGETEPRWKFKYNTSHELTEVTDGRKNTVTTTYEAGRVVSQKDAVGRERKWKYTGTEAAPETTITEPNTSTTVEKFNSLGLPTSVTRASGTGIAATTEYEYNGSYNLIAVTDPNKHTTKYGYNAAGDKTSETDPNSNETKWTYNSTHDIETVTTPKGETTTIKRDAHGNPEVIERPAPESKTQITKNKFAANGDLESMETPLKNVWKYEYDTKGDRTAEIDPLTNKRTWEYNEDSQETATVSPRGNVTGGKPAEFTTKTERDEQGRPLKIEDPLKHTTKYKYDGNGNTETLTDGNSHTKKYTYDADNERTKTEEPNKTVVETEFDSMGQVKSQTDGNKNTTKYERNLLEQVTEVTDPLARITKKTYDAAGNLKTLEDPAKRTTTFTHDPGNRLTEVSYSSGKPATVKYEYDKDGDRTKIEDGTGTTKNTFDQLDRLTETENGHKEISKYEWDLANEQTKITYPNGKAVTRAFDKDGRLEKVTDWLTHITKFGYNPDSELNLTTFPSETKNEDKGAYNNADQMTEVKMLKTTELASLVYTRDNDGQLKKTTSKGLPGAEITENTYDENKRLTKSGSEYKYDPANNPTTIGTGTYKYDKASELETGPGLTYTYELGERTKTKPTTGPATTYGYDQAQNLTSAERPEGESKPKIEDTYAYNGEGLRTSQTINGTTTNLAWDMTESLPLILSDETNSYIYGPNGIPVEQISAAETPTYLHHDQQGSTRLLTGSAGTITGKCTYTAYGIPTCEGTTTTPLGYAGQYTSTDTGLIYLRARAYDPATAQFLTVDPILSFTRAPYNYASDNPLNFGDASGLAVQVCVGATVSLVVTVEVNACAVITPHGPGVTGTIGGAYGGGAGVNIHAGVGGSNAQTAGEYGGVFGTAGGSAQAGFGGYAGGFVSPPGPCGQVIAGGTAGVTAGIGAEGGVGGSYTGVIEF